MWRLEVKMAESTLLPMCSMVRMCKRMIEKPGSSLMLLLGTRSANILRWKWNPRCPPMVLLQ